MTNEETVKSLKTLRQSINGVFDYNSRKQCAALDMAIKVLEQQPCDDCVSRKYIEPIVEELENICINGDEYILSLLSKIKNAPPVTPTRPKGKWINNNNDDAGEGYFICTNCKNDVYDVTAFCPNCGSDMRESEDSK